MRSATLGCVLVAGLALAACTAEAPAPEPQPEPEAQAPGAMFEPAVTLNQVMVDVINDHAHYVWDIDIPGGMPETDEDWAEIRSAATVLAAAGSITVLGGSGPDDGMWLDRPDWQRMSQSLTDAGLQALAAAERRNVDALREAGNALVITCIECHRSYRLEVPDIWDQVDARVPEQ